MAFASSRRGAQEAIIKPCDLCEDDENVHWFCKDCFQNLCERCKKMHMKTTNCKNHHVVSILEGISIAKETVSNLCKDHDLPFSFFCQTCEENICSKCLSRSHNKHEFIEIHEYLSELNGELNDVLEQKKREKEDITKTLEKFEEYRCKSEKTLKQNYDAIDDRVKAIQQIATEEGQAMKKLLKSFTDKHFMEAKKSENKLDSTKHIYDENIETVQMNLKLQTSSSLDQFVKTSISKLQALKPLSLSVPEEATFVVGNMNREHIRNMIGKEGNYRQGAPGSSKEEKAKKADLETIWMEETTGPPLLFDELSDTEYDSDELSSEEIELVRLTKSRESIALTDEEVKRLRDELDI